MSKLYYRLFFTTYPILFVGASIVTVYYHDPIYDTVLGDIIVTAVATFVGNIIISLTACRKYLDQAKLKGINDIYAKDVNFKTVVDIPQAAAYEKLLSYVQTMNKAKIKLADKNSGRIFTTVNNRYLFMEYGENIEIVVKADSDRKAAVDVCSKTRLKSVFFIDMGRNKQNVDQIIQFLHEGKEVVGCSESHRSAGTIYIRYYFTTFPILCVASSIVTIYTHDPTYDTLLDDILVTVVATFVCNVLLTLIVCRKYLEQAKLKGINDIYAKDVNFKTVVDIPQAAAYEKLLSYVQTMNRAKIKLADKNSGRIFTTVNNRYLFMEYGENIEIVVKADSDRKAAVDVCSKTRLKSVFFIDMGRNKQNVDKIIQYLHGSAVS